MGETKTRRGAVVCANEAKDIMKHNRKMKNILDAMIKTLAKAKHEFRNAGLSGEAVARGMDVFRKELAARAVNAMIEGGTGRNSDE